jgi:hypothetical protein
LCDAVDCLQVGVALEHAVINAMFHGNLEQAGPYRPDASNGEGATILSLAENSSHCDRRVHVDMRISREEATFVVRDEGAGFDVKEVSSVGLSTSLDGASGRGMLLMWAFMDQVSFDDAGNTVTLVKRRRVHLPADDADPEKATGPTLPDVLGELVAKSHGKTYQLTKRRLLVGREPSCDIVLNASSVSHHHCVMYLHEGWWYVKDLQSKNGLKVNQKPVTQHLLPPGAMLSVGTVNLEAKYHPDELGSPGMTPPVDPF